MITILSKIGYNRNTLYMNEFGFRPKPAKPVFPKTFAPASQYRFKTFRLKSEIYFGSGITNNGGFMKRSVIALMLLSVLILGDQMAYSDTTLTTVNSNVTSQIPIVGTMHRRHKIQRFNTQVDLYMKSHPGCTREEATNILKEQAINKTKTY
jgi:hypothetical protein